MKAIRAGLERYLTQAPHRKAFSIIHDKVFVPFNEALDSHLKSLAKTGVLQLSSTKHKQALVCLKQIEALRAHIRKGCSLIHPRDLGQKKMNSFIHF